MYEPRTQERRDRSLTAESIFGQEKYSDYLKMLFDTLHKDPTGPVRKYMFFWDEAQRFAVQSRVEKRPFQRLLAQNRFEINLAKTLGFYNLYLKTMERFIKLVTLIELPKTVRFWVSLFLLARTLSAYKKGYKAGVKAGITEYQARRTVLDTLKEMKRSE